MHAEGGVTKTSGLLVIFVSTLFPLDDCGTPSPLPPPPISDFSFAISPSSVSTQVGATTSPVNSYGPEWVYEFGDRNRQWIPQRNYLLSIFICAFTAASSFALSPLSSQQVTFSEPAARHLLRRFSRRQCIAEKRTTRRTTRTNRIGWGPGRR
jgi:hypothetical protein